MSAAGKASHEAAADWWSRMQGPDAERLRTDFEAWRTSDPRNAAEYEKFERTWDLAAGLGATQIGRARTLPPRARPVGWATPPRLALAAAAIVLIVLAVTLRPQGSQAPLIAQAYATSVGEIRTIRLPDGSSVTLDTDTRLEVRYDKDARLVTLERGRARFDVQPDPARRFLVASGGEVVAAHGAGFDVQLTPQGLCIRALRGALELSSKASATTSGAQLRLGPDQIVRFAPAGDLRTEPAGKGSDRWVEGMLVFHATPLSAVLAETNRYARRPIVLNDPALGALKVTGTFRPVPTDQLAVVLAAAFGLKVQASSDGDIVLGREAPASSAIRQRPHLHSSISDRK